MTAEEHIIAWIESSRPHYERLLRIEQWRTSPGPLTPAMLNARTFRRAAALVADAYHEMLWSGDASSGDPYSVAELCSAVKMLCEWTLEP